MQINRHALTDFMESEGWRLGDLAEKAGMSTSFLSELRSGTKIEISPARLRQLADALNVRVRSLAANPNVDVDTEAVSS